MQAWMPPSYYIVFHIRLVQQSVTLLENENTSSEEDANEDEEEAFEKEASPEPPAADSEDD